MHECHDIKSRWDIISVELLLSLGSVWNWVISPELSWGNNRLDRNGFAFDWICCLSTVEVRGCLVIVCARRKARYFLLQSHLHGHYTWRGKGIQSAQVVPRGDYSTYLDKSSFLKIKLWFCVILIYYSGFAYFTTVFCMTYWDFLKNLQLCFVEP